MSVGPSTSGFGFVLCKAFFQQLADERADVHPGGSHRPSSSGSNSLADEDGGVHLRQGDFHLLSTPNLHLFPGTLAQPNVHRCDCTVIVARPFGIPLTEASRDERSDGAHAHLPPDISSILSSWVHRKHGLPRTPSP